MTNSVVALGTGPRKVLALHGWFGGAENWGPFADVLDRDRFTYVFMDQRGYGGSRHLAGRYTLDEIAQDALAIADDLGWERFSLLGHSMGGASMQHVLARAPQRVQALVGIAPVPASGVPFDAAAWELFSAAAGDPQARRTIIDFSTGQRLSARWLDTMVARSLADALPEAVTGYLPSWARTDIGERVRGLRVPVLVIAGQHDAGLPADFLREAWSRVHPQAEFETMGNAGHYPMEETPVALATSVERFLLANLPAGEDAA